MTPLLSFVLVWLVLRTSSGSDTSGDDDLVQEFRNLFSEFLLGPPTNRNRAPSKHIRDTSKTDRKKSIKSETELRPQLDKLAGERTNARPKLFPLYDCNLFDVESRLCVNVRQLGTTLTIGARVEKGTDHGSNPPVHWYRVFVVRGPRGEQEEQFTFVEFTRESLPWNINIGGENNELRISPLTETDFSYNFFLATLDEGRPGKENMVQKKGHRQLLMFSIEPISIDMGPLYHGEEITINVRSHVELPPRSVRYEWARVSGSDFGVTRNLPSNMRLNRDGSALVIKEHRDYGGDDVTITCAVFTNRNFTLARRNFYLGKIVSAKVPSTKVTKEFGSTIFRKRRFLDDFYAQEMSPAKSKRDAEGANFWTEAPTTAEDFSDQREDALPVEFSEERGLGQEQESTSQFSIEEQPKETVLNFYGRQQLPPPEYSKEGGSESDPLLPQKQRGGTEPKKQPAQTMDELIHEANGFVEDEDAKQREGPPPMIRGRVNSYTTMRIVSEEKPTFEDRESMLMADCDRDGDCGINAVCYRVEGSKRFCRCKPHYRGNGLFCWLF